ncbi:Bromodomain-containing factor 1 [Hondaea fermentalgiana]|uniref:Bromodomain-containing factor 1 n=1 Tax=Hondaea fermentalgiana TaxID=2315210 RepID=A0A2R5GUP2_9STRA|nr:Bromodomain-containing factor 1 [Hondaea fermentalgiana]|eukprot:GBG32091.1 Bromodomain-containing factor 1 [Hondaea fermentalgiana]
MRPVMRGTLAKDGSGKLVFEGRWAMQEADLANVELCAPFQYERTGDLPVKTGERSGPIKTEAPPPHCLARSGLFAGFFDVQGVSPQQASKFTEKNVTITFAKRSSSSADKVFSVKGSGTNKLGKFTLSGELDESSGLMTIFREYAPRRRAASGQNRRQRELGMLSSTGVSAVRTPATVRGQRKKRNTVATNAEVAATATVTAAGVSESGCYGPVTKSDKAMLEKLAGLLEDLMERDTQRYFCAPVDAEKLALLDYHQIVAHPMDLGTVKTRASKDFYATAVAMQKDIEQTFSNALLYNARGSAVYKKAAELAATFASGLRELLQISTPRCVLGKRQSIPKVAFEVTHESSLGPKRVKRSHSSNSGGQSNASSCSKKSKVKQLGGGGGVGNSIVEDEEVARLRAQVASMSQHLQQLQGASPIGPLSPFGKDLGFDIDFDAATPVPLAPAQPIKRSAKSERALARAQKLYEMKRRLGRDINLLNGDKLRRILDMIAAAGVELPISAFGEIELDLDLLNEDTLKSVRKFVSRQLQAIQPNYRPLA